MAGHAPAAVSSHPHGAKDSCSRPHARRPGTVCHRLRRDRKLAVFRAWPDLGICAVGHAVRVPRCGPPVRARRRGLRRRRSHHRRARRRRELCPAGVQRPGRLHRRVGRRARLRDRDRALSPVRAALSDRRVRSSQRALGSPGGACGRRSSGCDHRASAGSAHECLHGRHPACDPRSGGAGEPGGARHRAAVQLPPADQQHQPRGRADLELAGVLAAGRDGRLHRPGEGVVAHRPGQGSRAHRSGQHPDIGDHRGDHLCGRGDRGGVGLPVAPRPAARPPGTRARFRRRG